MPRVPQSYNNTTPVEKFDNTAYDAVELVAQNIDAVIAAAGGVDVMALYLGAYDTEPTQGHDGEPLVSGNFYLDTTSSSLKYWDAENSVWVESDVDAVVTAAQDAIAAKNAAEGFQEAAEAASTVAINEATNAASSASAASNSASNAATSEINAHDSAQFASDSATYAAQAATAAQNSENAASTFADESAASATNSENSATAAAASESNAASSAVSAANFASQAEAAFDNFDDMYLGRKTEDPTVDNDGNPLQVGASYWHDNGDDTGEQRFWNGASWESPELTATQAAQAAVAARDDAQISETNAANSANAAGADANAAGNSATDAANSASAAAASESGAEGFKDDAETAQGIAQSAANAAGVSESNAATSETNASAFEAKAEQWAEEAEDTEVEPNKYSAKHWATKAADSAADVSWKLHARGEAELNQMRAQNQDARAASGFDHYGKHWTGNTNNNGNINEGLWAATNGLYLAMGRNPNDSLYGTSKTTFPVTHIAGFISEIVGSNPEVEGYERSYIKLPEAPNGTVIFDSTGNARGTGLRSLDFTVDVDPQYGDVAGDVNEAVARAFEGEVVNGDFRNGTANWVAGAGTGFTVTDGEAQVIDTGTGDQYVYQFIDVAEGDELELEFAFTGQDTPNTSMYIELAYGGTASHHTYATTTLGNHKMQFTVPADNGGNMGIRIRASNVSSGWIKTKSVVVRKATEEVVIDRHDLFGGEFFLEEVSQANPYVYPKGMIQSRASTMNGIETVRSNRPDSYYWVYDNDSEIYMGASFGSNDGAQMTIPEWLPTTAGNNTVRMKVRLDSFATSGSPLFTNDGTPGPNSYLMFHGNYNNALTWSSQFVAGVKVDGVSVSSTSFVPELGVEYEIECKLNTLDRGGIAGFGSLIYIDTTSGVKWCLDGEIWDIELIDHDDPSNNRFYPVRKYQADGDKTLTSVAETSGPISTTFSDGIWDTSRSTFGTIVDNQLTVSSNSTSAGRVAVWNPTWLLKTDRSRVVTVTFDLVSYTGDTGGTRLIAYREGPNDGNCINARDGGTRFGQDDVGTRVTLTSPPEGDYSNDVDGLVFYTDTVCDFVIENINVTIELDGTLENFSTNAWNILSGTLGGGSAGLGVDFWAASDQEKIDLVSDHSNNLFLLSDGRMCQWRMRQRTCTGAHNGDWDKDGQSMDPSNRSRYGLTAGRESSVAQGYLDSVPAYGTAYWTPTNGTTSWQVDNPNNGVFKPSAGYGGAPHGGMFGECYFHVWGVIRRLNQGAYHPSFNPLGTRTWVQSGKGWAAYWTGVDGVSGPAQCFNYLTASDDLTNAGPNADLSGYIGSRDGSGRPDGRLFDAIYNGGDGGVNDHRLPSWDMSSKEEASKVFQKVAEGTFRGEERVPFTELIQRDTAYTAYYSGGRTAIWVFGIRDKVVNLGLDTSECMVDNFVCATSATDGQGQYIYMDARYGDLSSYFNSKEWLTFTYPHESSVSGEFQMVDVLGDPEDIRNITDLMSGWQGRWQGNHDQDNTTDLYPLTRKSLNTSSNMPFILTVDNGATWQSGVTPFDSTKNAVSYTSVPNRVMINVYTAFAKQTKEADSNEVLNQTAGIGNVYATQGSARWSGCFFAESLTGKVNTSNSSVQLNESPITDTRGLYLGLMGRWSSSTDNDNPRHSALTLNADGSNESSAVKALWYQVANSYKVSMNFAWNELVYGNPSYSTLDTSGTANIVTNAVYFCSGGLLNGNFVRCLTGYNGINVSLMAMSADGEVMDTTTGRNAPNLTGATSNYKWGDDTTIRIKDGTATFTNLNGDTCLSGTSTLSKPIGYTKNQARIGEQDEGVDL